MAYIANKPVRFDKDYSIGEIVPDEVIDPKMKKRLIDWGKIIQVKLPINKEESEESAELPANKEESEENIQISDITIENKSKKKNAAKKG